jgi:hypothetical protein
LGGRSKAAIDPLVHDVGDGRVDPILDVHRHGRILRHVYIAGAAEGPRQDHAKHGGVADERLRPDQHRP